MRAPITREAAHERLARQMAGRGAMFLESTRRQIYANPRSPYRALLLAVGCDHAELARRVTTLGLEATLAGLADAGVRVSLEEFKRQRPIERESLRLTPDESDFDNP
ncbi:MAG TPA: hypothetical protein VF720_10290, partial [Candidatus Eisenbacteria bacterium]